MRSPGRQRETERQKARNNPPEGMATPQSLLRSPLRILGTHEYMPSVSFKPPGSGRKLRSTAWESSDIAIVLTAGPYIMTFSTTQ